jgi:hypothetical protein
VRGRTEGSLFTGLILDTRGGLCPEWERGHLISLPLKGATPILPLFACGSAHCVTDCLRAREMCVWECVWGGGADF